VDHHGNPFARAVPGIIRAGVLDLQSGEAHREWVIIPYRPIIWLWKNGPEAVGDSVVWYSSLGATADWGWTQHIDRSENTHELEWGPL